MDKLLEIEAKKSCYCYSGCLCNFLAYKGLHLSEPMCLGLSAGMQFSMEFDPSFKLQCLPPEHYLTDVVSKLGVKVQEEAIVDIELLHKHLKHQIVQKETPVLIDCDAFFISYAKLYHQEHKARFALVSGYGFSNVYLSDFVYPVLHYPILHTDLQQAVSCSNFPYQCKLYHIDADISINERITQERIEQVVAEEIKNFILDSSETTGINGMRFFVKNAGDFISRAVDQENWVELLAELKNMSISIRSYGDFLAETVSIGLLMNSVSIDWLDKPFFYAARAWDISCNLMVKYGITRENHIIQRIERNLELALYQLELGYNNLLSLIRKCW